ncbi:MAG: hypothetical protein P8N56_05290 [Schleiferiaceae bacterium]|nr:hypothetical protein [Schleiferiaceae bacterium]
MKKILLSLCSLVAISACQGPAEEAEAAIEMLLADASNPLSLTLEDTSGWRSTLSLIERASASVESDSLWARYTLVSADVQAQIPGGALYAVRNYLSVYDSLPKRVEGALGLLGAAIVFEEKLQDHGRAIQTLTILTDAYPNTAISRTAMELRDVITFETEASLLDKIHQWKAQDLPQQP